MLIFYKTSIKLHKKKTNKIYIILKTKEQQATFQNKT